MATQAGQNVGTTNGTTAVRRRTRRRAGAKIPLGSRPGTGTGTGGTMAGNISSVVAIEHFGHYMRGAVEGFALANNLGPQQVLNGSKKFLTW